MNEGCLKHGLLASLIASWMWTGCSKTQPDSPMVKAYAVTGVVEQIQQENGRAVIAHEAIPGYMDAMTMPFNVRNSHELARLKLKDRIVFKLKVTEQESWIEDIQAIGATAPTPGSVTQGSVKREEAPDDRFMFTNELGKPIHLKDFAGRPLALTFFFTRCPVPDYCPRLSKNFQEASGILKGTSNAPVDWQFLSVTIDPENDTPEAMKAYGRRYGYDSNHWSFLTGPKGRVENLARMFGLQFDQTNGLYNHGFRTVIINRSNKVQQIFPVVGDLSKALADEIMKASAGAAPKP